MVPPVFPHSFRTRGRDDGTDERGAVMVMAVFMAIFLVAILYYTVGIAESIVHAEALQDAADAGTLSAAIMHARGMNFIVLLNIVMAAIMAILIVIRLVEGLAIIGMAVAAALSWVTFGASATLIPVLNSVRTAMHEAYETLEPPISNVTKLLHTVADGVRVVVPLAAEASMGADAVSQQGGASPVKAGFFIPKRLTLPVTDDDPKVLCAKSGSFVVGLAFKPLNDRGIDLGPIQDALDGAVSGLTGALSNWFCGVSGGAPPVHEQKVRRVLPRTEAMESCERTASQAACDEAARERELAGPDPRTGQCVTSCELSGPYERFIELARVQCAPAREITEYRFQRVAGSVEYRYLKGRGWVRGEPRLAVPELVSDSAPPCGAGGRYATSYNTRVHPGSSSEETLPVCSNELPPEPPAPEEAAAGRVEPEIVRFVEIKNIIDCTKPYVKRVNLGEGEAFGANLDASRATKTMEDGVELGADDFQLRGVVVAKAPSDRYERIVRLARWGRGADSDGVLGRLRELSRLAVAQAEYFYEGRATPAEQLWNMNWRGRLVRFRLPSAADQSWRDNPNASHGLEQWGGSSGASESPCGSFSGQECGSITQGLERMAEIIVH